MPNRDLREGFLSSELVASLTADEERLYVRLLLCADDFGRFDAKPTLVKSRAFPLADEMVGISVKSVTACLQALFHKRAIRLYEVEGKSYMQIEKWRQRLRAQHSKYPPPPDFDAPNADQKTGERPANDSHPPDGCQTDAGHSPSSAHEVRTTNVELRTTAIEVRGASTPARTRKASANTEMPDDFAISERVREWFGKSAFHAEPLTEHFDAFCLKVRAKGYRYSDWDSALMEAIRADWAGVRSKRGGGGFRPGGAVGRQAELEASNAEAARRVADRIMNAERTIDAA